MLAGLRETWRILITLRCGFALSERLADQRREPDEKARGEVRTEMGMF
jgi:hypothetical protein